MLLPWVEKGIVTLIGATTENPSFTVINALLSRCRTYVLEAIKTEDIVAFLKRNKEHIRERYPKIDFENEKILELIASLGNGDLRSTMNILETACILQGV